MLSCRVALVAPVVEQSPAPDCTDDTHQPRGCCLAPEQQRVLQENVVSGTKFKETREAERKAQAGNRAAWNSLFMRPDTVAEAVAAHYGISKAQLLSKEAADLPVRMALGEAHVVALTKKALGDAGESLQQPLSCLAASSSWAMQALCRKVLMGCGMWQLLAEPVDLPLRGLLLEFRVLTAS